jgi:hypothetical protein
MSESSGSPKRKLAGVRPLRPSQSGRHAVAELLRLPQLPDSFRISLKRAGTVDKPPQQAVLDYFWRLRGVLAKQGEILERWAEQCTLALSAAAHGLDSDSEQASDEEGVRGLTVFACWC